MICLNKIKDHSAPLNIDAIQIGNEVHLRREGEDHSFVIVKRDANGDAVVGLNEKEKGVKEWKNIHVLAWGR